MVMTEILKRIDDLIDACSKDGQDLNYFIAKTEIKNLIIDIAGKGEIYADFEKIDQETIYLRFPNSLSKSQKMIGVLNSLKNYANLKTQKKKYQIFISSTYQDLSIYRNVVADEIAFLGHIPAGMENFTACGEQLETYIKHVIDESDYYLLIIGQRFGTSLPKNKNISYTMMEYEYAKSKGMRIIPLIYNGTQVLVGNDLDVNKKRFDQFVAQVSKTVVQYFKDEKELIRVVTKALESEIKNHPQKGWVRW